jgi:UDP-2,4-diacetamido-2,4,6-trideoxy-beta-L-altropyranose hydrolase
MEFSLEIRPACLDDAKLLWEWANDPLVRKFSFNRPQIEFEHHLTWFREKLQTYDTSFWIVEYEGMPAAQIRYERRSRYLAEVNFSVAAGLRSKGIGRSTLLQTECLVHKALAVDQLRALVLVDNQASIRVFRRCGYSLVGKREVRGFECLEFHKDIHSERIFNNNG